MSNPTDRRRVLTWAAAAGALALLPACQTTVAKRPRIKPRVVNDVAAIAARKKRIREEASSGY